MKLPEDHDEGSLCLLTRIFSLFPFKQQANMKVDQKNLDIDLAVFLTYA